MDGTELARILTIVAGIGLADAAASSWRLLRRPLTPRAMTLRSIGQAVGSGSGILAWIGVLVAAHVHAVPSADRLAVAAGLVTAMVPLLFAVLARIPVLGRPVLALLHVLAVIGVATTAGQQLDTGTAWAATVTGYACFAAIRVLAGSRGAGHQPPLHLQLTGSRGRGTSHAS